MSFRSRNVIFFENGRSQLLPISLVEEEPLSIRIQGKPYLILLRTPGYEKNLAVGLCLSEGIIDKLEDISSIGFCDGNETNTITITLTKQRYSVISNILKRKSYISNSSCGFCGKEIIEDISSAVQPVKNISNIRVKTVFKALSNLNKYQPLRRKTRTTHCSVICDERSNLLSSAEDVGRHNSLDKSVGNLLLNGDLKKAKMIILSSRVSYELILKAARARIPIVAAVSRATSLAVDLAEELNITLATLLPDKGIIVYCHEDRLYGKF